MRVCVVGAGASGLPAIKTCIENQFDVVCFEKSNDIAGLWRYKEKPSPGEGSVMKSTVINTSKEMTAYSDFVPPDDTPNFMHNSELLKYFRLYSQRFDLLKYIKFQHEVISISRGKMFSEKAQWDVRYRDLSDGVIVRETFDAVMLCTGHHSIPYWPTPFPGQDNFKGQIIHSHEFRDLLSYKDKIVVVIGIGNSGGDIAVELSKIAKKVYLATRTGTWVFNRIWERGEPADLVFLNRYIFTYKRILPFCLVNYIIEKKIEQRFDHGRYGLRPRHRVLQAHITINDELPNRIASGTLVVKTNVSRFTENDVYFDDDTVVRDVDNVIFATGYSFEFSLIENGSLIPVYENQVSLYKYMFAPQLSPQNTLAVIGLIQPWGSIMPISEMQCRVFCEVLAGRLKLCDSKLMLADIEQKKNEMHKQYVARRRHTIQVYYVDYMDELAKMIGVKPSPIKYLLKDPKLAYTLLFEGLAPYQYRLQGINKWDGARDALLGMKKRCFETTRTRKSAETLRSKPLNKFCYAFRLAI